MTTPYNDPQNLHNPSTGTVPPASWGDAVRDGLQFLATGVGARAKLSGSISTTNATSTPITLTVEDWDTDNFHSVSSNTSRMGPLTGTGLGGHYLIGGFAQWAANATGVRSLTLSKNGTGTIEVNLSAPGAALDSNNNIITMLNLNAGDYVEMFAYQTSTGPLSVTAAHLWMVCVGLT